MITKAYIISKTENNTYRVRIPIFESNNNQSTELTEIAEDTPIFEASLSYNPGTIDSYKEGDVVYISFEDNDYDNVIIIGKLYQGNEDEVTNYQAAQTLNVVGETELTNETYIDGININDLFLKQSDFNNYVNNLTPSITYRILSEYDD